MPLRIILYGKPDCHLCHEAQALLERLATEYDLNLIFIDITQDLKVWERYWNLIPVIEIENGPRLESKVSEAELRRLLDRAGVRKSLAG